MFNSTSNELYDILVAYITTNQDKFYRIAYTYVKNEQAALDTVQESIYKALTHHQSLKTKDYIQTWFYRILVNECLSYLRKQKPILSLSSFINSIVHTDNYPLDELDMSEKLDALPPKIKTIIILHYFESLTLSEIADITNTNLSTVKSRLYKGLKLLKVKYEEEETLYESH